MKTHITLLKKEGVLASLEVEHTFTDEHTISVHELLPAGGACLIELRHPALTKLLELTETVPYLFLFFDEENAFTGATFSLNESRQQYHVNTEAKKVLALPFPTAFSAADIHLIEGLVIRELNSYKEADNTFYVRKNGSDDSFILEVDIDFEPYERYEGEWDDEDMKEWAKDNEYLSEDAGYLKDDGSIDYESLRETRWDEEEAIYNQSPPSYATPSGRAFLWFEDLEFSIPEDIELNLIDGYSPGNDWQAVMVKGVDSLIRLQDFLVDNGLKVNFDMNPPDYEEQEVDKDEIHAKAKHIANLIKNMKEDH